MGDRANVEVVEGGRRLYFYTHWTGWQLPELVARGLDRGRDRWDDPPYLNRIIFDAIRDGDDATTGYGISTYIGDGARQTLVVDHDRQSVHHIGADDGGWSFAEYVALAGHSWDDLEQNDDDGATRAEQ